MARPRAADGYREADTEAPEAVERCGQGTPRDIPDRGKVSLVTLMRPTNFEVYRDMAATWTPHKAQQAPEPSTAAPAVAVRRAYWAASND